MKITCRCGGRVRDEDDANSAVSVAFGLNDLRNEDLWDPDEETANDNLFEFEQEHGRQIWECKTCGILWFSERGSLAMTPYYPENYASKGKEES